MKKREIDFLQNIAPTSKNFERNVIKLLPKETKKVWMGYVTMERANGCGSYNYVLNIEIDGCGFNLKVHSNYSPDWDAYKDLEHGSTALNNWNKRVALMILEKNQEYVAELLTEEED